MRPGDTATNSTNSVAQKASSQRRERGPGPCPGREGAGRAAAGGGAWTVLVMENTAGG